MIKRRLRAPFLLWGILFGLRMTTIHIDGQCHCGQITFEAQIDPETVSVCHCTDCQTLTGSPTRLESLAFSPDGKTLASGGSGTEAEIRLWPVPAAPPTSPPR